MGFFEPNLGNLNHFLTYTLRKSLYRLCMKVGCRPLSFSQFIGFIHISRTKFAFNSNILVNSEF